MEFKVKERRTKWQKIIDTHSHILPGIDDGAGSWKEALCMLKTAQAQGIRRVIATPHWGGPFGYTDPVQIRELCFTLQEKARRHNISVKIYQGQEVMYTEEAADRIANGEILTLADSRYVLAEFYQGIGYSGIFGQYSALHSRDTVRSSLMQRDMKR